MYRPFGPFSVASKVWRTSKSPLLAGMVVFSLILVVAAAGVYASTIPGALGAGSYAAVFSDDSPSGMQAPESARASASDSQEAFEAGENGVDVTADGWSPGGLAGGSVPLVSMIDSIMGGATSGSEGGGNAAPDAPAQTPSATPGTPVAPPADTGLSAAQEEAIHSRLTSIYDSMAQFVAPINDSFSTFFALHDGASQDVAAQQQNSTASLMSAVRATFNAQTDNGNYSVPSNSKYFQKYKDIVACYNELVGASSLLPNVWLNIYYGAQPADYMAHVNQYTTGGKSNHMVAFERMYPAARP